MKQNGCRSPHDRIEAGHADDAMKVLLLWGLLLQVRASRIGCAVFCEEEGQQWCQGVLWLAVVGVVLCEMLREQWSWQWVLQELCERQRRQQRSQRVLSSAVVEETIHYERLWEQQRWHGVLWSTMWGCTMFCERQTTECRIVSKHQSHWRVRTDHEGLPADWINGWHSEGD